MILAFISTAAGWAQAQTDERDAGIHLYREGKFAEAASQLESVATLDSKDRQAWLYLGAAYEHLGRREDAKKALRASRMQQTTNLEKFDKKLAVKRKPQAQFRRDIDEATPVVISVAVEFRADGTIGVVVPFQDRPSDHEDSVIRAARSIEFEPAEIGGKPVTTVMVLAYKFARY